MILLTIVGFIGMMIVSSIFNGYALSVLWGWFVVPTFGLPELTIAPAIGLAMVVSYLTHQHRTDEKSEKNFGEQMATTFSWAISKPLFALLFGWVVHLFM